MFKQSVFGANTELVFRCQRTRFGVVQEVTDRSSSADGIMEYDDNVTRFIREATELIRDSDIYQY